MRGARRPGPRGPAPRGGAGFDRWRPVTRRDQRGHLGPLGPRAGGWALLLLLLLLAQGALAAPRGVVILPRPGREGLAIQAARATDPGGREVVLDSDAGRLRFSAAELALEAGAAAASAAAADADLVPGPISVRLRDGVIRWFTTAAPEQELLALWVLDARRFVVWTPAGYFAARGPDADLAAGTWCELSDGHRAFLPLREFAAELRRDDVLRQALAAARPAAPPPALPQPRVGRVVVPSDGVLFKGPQGDAVVEITTAAPATVALRSWAPRGPARPDAAPGVDADLGGGAGVALASVSELGARGLVPGAAAGGGGLARDPRSSWRERVRFAVPPPPAGGDGAERVVELRPPSLGGRAVSLHLTWRGGWRVALPDLYVLAVGVNAYQEQDYLTTLRFAVKDAQDIQQALQGQEGRRYRRVVSRTLTDGQVTLAGLRAGLAWLRREARERDVVMIYLAGHGVSSKINDEQRYFFLPVAGHPERLVETALSDEELFESLSACHAATVVLFLDTCRSGTSPAQRRLLERLQASGGVIVYSATQANRPSLERVRWGNGAFTRALVEGLRGGADVKGDGRITASALEHFISSRVKELTGGEQEPTTVKATTDLWLAQGRPQYHRRWWLWTAVGAVTAGAVLGASLGVALREQVETIHFSFSTLRHR